MNINNERNYTKQVKETNNAKIVKSSNKTNNNSNKKEMNDLATNVLR